MTAAETQPGLPANSADGCSHCNSKAPEFQVGPDMRACGPHVSDVLDAYFKSTWDGWQPATVAPIRTSGATR